MSVWMICCSLALTRICERLGECLYEILGGCLNTFLSSSSEVNLGQSSARCLLVESVGSKVVTKVNGSDVLLRPVCRYWSLSSNGMMGESVMCLG